LKEDAGYFIIRGYWDRKRHSLLIKLSVEMVFLQKNFICFRQKMYLNN